MLSTDLSDVTPEPGSLVDQSRQPVFVGPKEGPFSVYEEGARTPDREELEQLSKKREETQRELQRVKDDNKKTGARRVASIVRNNQTKRGSPQD